MPKTVADQFVDTLAAAGVKRIYGIVGYSLNGAASRAEGSITLQRVAALPPQRVERVSSYHQAD